MSLGDEWDVSSVDVGIAYSRVSKLCVQSQLSYSILFPLFSPGSNIEEKDKCDLSQPAGSQSNCNGNMKYAQHRESTHFVSIRVQGELTKMSAPVKKEDGKSFKSFLFTLRPGVQRRQVLYVFSILFEAQSTKRTILISLFDSLWCQEYKEDKSYTSFQFSLRPRVQRRQVLYIFSIFFVAKSTKTTSLIRLFNSLRGPEYKDDKSYPSFRFSLRPRVQRRQVVYVFSILFEAMSTKTTSLIRLFNYLWGQEY
jgi:hypothetical protein